jgi:predicted PurR-regulated permease PerM
VGGSESPASQTSSSADDSDRSGDPEPDRPAHKEAGVLQAGESVTATIAARPDPYGERPTRTRIRAPFGTGFLLGAGALLAYWVGGLILHASSVLILIVVSLFIAFGLNPVVRWLVGRGIRRSYAVLTVALGLIAALALFSLAIAPVIADQVSALTANAPGYFDQLQHNRQIQEWDEQYDIIDRARDYVTSGDLTQQLFGGALGVGLAILAFLGNAFVVIVLTLYFLATLDTVKEGLYRLAPSSRRQRVAGLGDRILEGIGGYVSGAFIVAMCAGISTLVFLFIVGLGKYAVALSVVVAILDVIPMIGATLGAVIVSAIGLATDLKVGIACIIFYLIYQQLENYVIYPRVMSRSVDIPGSVTVIAALIGASLLGVVGALLAIPTAAAILLLVREVFIRKQETR